MARGMQAAALAVILLPLAAAAQTPGGYGYKQPLASAQLNGDLGGKVDTDHGAARNLALTNPTVSGSLTVNGRDISTAATGSDIAAAVKAQASQPVGGDLIGVLPDLHIACGSDAEPWQSAAVPVSASSGALGAATAVVRFRKGCATVLMVLTVTVTANGTGSGAIFVEPMPWTSNYACYCHFSGRDEVFGSVPLSGDMAPGNNGVQITNLLNNGYPANTGSLLVVSGPCEVVQ